MRLVTANTLSTAAVRSPAGEDVGKIVDFMLDTQQHEVVYAALAVGGVLGVGAKVLAIPPASLRYEAARHELDLTVDTATLEEARGFDRANPPDHADDVLEARAPRPRSAPPTSRS